MEHNPLQKCFAPHIENFFAFIKAGKELQVTYELLLVYKNICVDNPDNDINAITTQVRQATTQHIKDDDVL